jgi:hypothetical protein
MIQSLTPTRWCTTSLAKLAYIQVPIARLYWGIYDIYIYTYVLYIYTYVLYIYIHMYYKYKYAICVYIYIQYMLT